MNATVCGICGILTHARPAPDLELARTARAMAETLHHRGPDADGVWVDGAEGVAFGHRRLSILDPSPEGAQPMLSHCERYVLTYNGEIYNFRELRSQLRGMGHTFRGHSDTEVLLEAISRWGPRGAAERSEGMFAFAVWDRRHRTLHLVRDRIGKKPLYYGRQNGSFFFGSELKAFRALPGFRPEVDRAALANLIQFSYIPAPRSIFAGVYKLEPGTVVTVEAAKPNLPSSLQTFWSGREVAERGVAEAWRGTPDEAEEVLHELLRDSVERRMVADVPIGAFLSGGIDSSAVVALMQSMSDQRVRTFTVGFGEAAYDETQHARAVAMHLGTDHTDLAVTPYQAREVIPLLPSLYDEPFADTSQIPTYLVSRLARQDVVVALSGDGGDELFGGYDRYVRCMTRWRGLSLLPASLRTRIGEGMARIASRSWSQHGPRWLGRLDRVSEAFAARDVRDLFCRMNARCPSAADYVLGVRQVPSLFTESERWARLDHPLDWMMSMDLAGHLPEDILVKVDRASMGVGLEVRNPLLDHRVVELAWRLPRDLKLHRGEPKWLLRRVLERYVPRAIFERPKMGFGIPLGAWLRGPLRDWAEALLDEDHLEEGGYFEAAAVREAWDQHLAGWRDRRFLLWNILSFQAWLDDGMGSGSRSC